MKKVAKTKGWAAFYAPGSMDNVDNSKDYYQIQRIDDPDGYLPAFRRDYEAIQYVVRKAMRGDKKCVDALWTCWADSLVHQVIWEITMNWKGMR